MSKVIGYVAAYKMRRRKHGVLKEYYTYPLYRFDVSGKAIRNYIIESMNQVGEGTTWKQLYSIGWRVIPVTKGGKK